MLSQPTLMQVGLGLVLHEADTIFDTGGLPLDDIVAVSLLLYFGVQTLRVRHNSMRPQHIASLTIQTCPHPHPAR